MLGMTDFVGRQDTKEILRPERPELQVATAKENEPA
jgi:hypothetical protein